MAIPRFNEDMDVIAKLADRPNDTQGLTAAQLKARFDKSGVDIKSYINDTLLPYLESGAAASNMGIEEITGLDAETVQAALEALAAESATLSCSVSGSTITISDLTPFETAAELVQSDANIVLETDIGKYRLPLVKKTGVSPSASLLFVGTSLNFGYGYLIVASFSVPYGSTATSISGTYSEIRIPKPSDFTPQMDGVGDAGSSVDFARADHVHPSDTSKYEKPVGGIPASDLDSDVQASLGKADTAYQRPSTGIPASALAIAVRTSLNKADSAYQKPANGIPSSDIDPEALPKPAAYAPQMDGVAAKGISSLYAREDHVHPSDTSKITMPAGGSVGQVLKKTANGTEWADESGSGGGTSDYADLTNKPSINSVTLSGNKTAADLGLAPGWSVEADTNTGAVTKSLSERVSCLFTGALTSLTITLGGNAGGHYHFDFSTGSTAPTLTLPSTVLTPDGFAVEANKAYEVDILNKHAAIQSWSLS